MKLLVISHTPHYQRGKQVVGWGPTVRELDYLATLFETLIHLAILNPDAPPASALPYTASNIHTVLLPPAGGDRLANKAGILKLAPVYFGEIRRQVQAADVVQVRCPANISLLALLTLGFTRQPHHRWFKYAGNWRPQASRDPLAYRLQRWLLGLDWAHGPVTINGHWPNQPGHVYSLDNPSLSQAEVIQALRLAANKTLDQPLHFLFVGRAESAKGLGRALQILACLREQGIQWHFDVIGDGPELREFKNQSGAFGFRDQTCFHGSLPRPELDPFYLRAHFLLLPSSASEGWPKVLSEAMSYGVVPLAGDVSSIPQILSEIGCGAALPHTAIDRYLEVVQAYLANPARWRAESQRGQQASGRFTYETYGAALVEMFHRTWGISLTR